MKAVVGAAAAGAVHREDEREANSWWRRLVEVGEKVPSIFFRLAKETGTWQKNSMSGKIPAKITERFEWESGLFTIQLDARKEFAPGQFFNLGLEFEGEAIRRSYSAASAPNQPLEFFISEVQSGQLTPKVAHLQVGDSILLDETPLGFFTLDEVPECRDLWLVGTGTGIGPSISMLREGSVLKRFENVYLVHGVRTESQLAYAGELRALSADLAHFHYLPTLSGKGVATADGVLQGRITEIWDNGALSSAGGEFGQDSHMLLCGNPQMIDEMVGRLKARGFEKHRRRKPGHFNFERYW